MHGLEGERKVRPHMRLVNSGRIATLPPPHSVSSSETPLDAFSKDGRKIQVGECALFQAGSAPPFIGVIQRATEGKEDYLKLSVNWLYRAADLKLAKGTLLDAAPNEVFYSFHRNVIPAASLLHPCKVAFLPKGVELPLGVPSFVCRRLYDIANKRLWWLTDQDHVNDHQEEVDRLLNKTRLEMQAAVQSDGYSPTSLDASATVHQLKSGTDNVENSRTFFCSHSKGKKRLRNHQNMESIKGNQGTEITIKRDQGTEPVKLEHSAKPDYTGAVTSTLDNFNAEITKISEKGRLVSIEGVENLVTLMQLDISEKKIDLTVRMMLTNVIAATEKNECLVKFMQLKGVPVLDEWLQEVHKGKAENGSPRENDLLVEDFLLSLLRALEKLPIYLNALQTCNIGKSVNHLRSHKNLEVQKRARGLVDTWKKRVDAEMSKINDEKSFGSSQSVSCTVKPGYPDVSYADHKRTGSTEAATKLSISRTACKALTGKPGISDPTKKSILSAPVSVSLKDPQCKTAGSNEGPELPSVTIKEEMGGGSCQSKNNNQSCSSDQGKFISSLLEEGRSSTAGSGNTSKQAGSSSRNRRSSNLPLVTHASGTEKETHYRSVSVNKFMTAEKAVQSDLACVKPLDMPVSGHDNINRLIFRLPNTARSPGKNGSGGSFEEPLAIGNESFSPSMPDKQDHKNEKVRSRSDVPPCNIAEDANTASWKDSDGKEGLVRTEGVISLTDVLDGECGGNAKDIEKVADSPSTALPVGDDIRKNLLPTVATGKFSVSTDLVGFSSLVEEQCTGTSQSKSSLCEDDMAQTTAQHDVPANADSEKQVRSAAGVSEVKLVEAIIDGAAREPEVKELDGDGAASLEDKKITHAQVSDINTDDVASSGRKLEMPLAKEPPALSPAEQELLGGDASTDQQTPDADDGRVDAIVLQPADSVPFPQDIDECKIMESENSVIDHMEITDKGKEQRSVSPPRSDELVKTSAVSLVSAKSVGDLEESQQSCPVTSTSHEEPPPSTIMEIENPAKSKTSWSDAEAKDELVSSAEHCLSIPPAKKNVATTLELDLNKGIPGDDGNQGHPVISAATHFPRLSPFANPKLNDFPSPIMVAEPTKELFLSPEVLLTSNSEPGWRGSADTSAFRLAEPRKVMGMPPNILDIPPSSSAGKQSWPLLDIDLNVADEQVLEDMACNIPAGMMEITGDHDAPARAAGGVDLDLNQVDDGSQNGLLMASTSCRSEMSLLPMQPAASQFSGREANVLRNFDLNDRPGFDEVVIETGQRNPQAKWLNKPTLATVADYRTYNSESRDVPSWYHPNSYPMVAIPSRLPDRGEQSSITVAAGGSQRILGSFTGDGNLGIDVYQGPVLSSSPAMVISPTTAISYPNFPFPSNFPLAPTSLSGSLTTFIDSSSGTGSCFSAFPLLLVPPGSVSSHYQRPYMINFPEGSTSGTSDNNLKWSRQGLDLNTGSGSGYMEEHDEKLSLGSRQLLLATSHACTDDQARMYGLPVLGSKRKEPEGGKNADRSAKILSRKQ